MPDTEEEPVLSSDDAAEPLFDTFRNAPRHPRSKTRQKRRRIAVPIETSTDTRHMQANDAAGSFETPANAWCPPVLLLSLFYD